MKDTVQVALPPISTPSVPTIPTQLPPHFNPFGAFFFVHKTSFLMCVNNTVNYSAFDKFVLT